MLLVAGLVVSTLATFFVARALVRPLQCASGRCGARRRRRARPSHRGPHRRRARGPRRAVQPDGRCAAGVVHRPRSARSRQRTGELSEALHYQTAISEVLRVISESTTDVHARVRCDPRVRDPPLRQLEWAAVYRYDGRLVSLMADIATGPAEAVEAGGATSIRRCPPRSVDGRAGVIPERPGHQQWADALTDPDYQTAYRGRRQLAAGSGWRADAEGRHADRRDPGLVATEPGETPARQADLLKTFADQAVIAIENVRLFNETKDALRKVEQRTARAERGARLPGGDQRRAARHQPVADRRRAGVRGDPRLRDPPVRQRGRRRLPLPRRPGRAGRDAQLAGRGGRGRALALSGAAEQGAAGRARHPRRGRRSASTTRCSTLRTTMRSRRQGRGAGWPARRC